MGFTVMLPQVLLWSASLESLAVWILPPWLVSKPECVCGASLSLVEEAKGRPPFDTNLPGKGAYSGFWHLQKHHPPIPLTALGGW